GFMIGTKVERAGIIRAGAKMISAVSEATGPRISVIVRKAYGAGLYAMGGPGFGPDCTLALPGAMVAVMGPEAAGNAVYFTKSPALPEADRAPAVARLRSEYEADIDIEKLGAELVIDAIIPPERLREELAVRFARYSGRREARPPKKHAVYPV